VVARAEAAGVGACDDLDRSSATRRCWPSRSAFERDVLGRHAIRTTRHEELDITADDLIARATHPKVVAIGEGRSSTITTTTRRATRRTGFRTPIAAARASGLPLVIHTRGGRRGHRADSEQEMGQGPSRRAALLHAAGGWRAAPSRSAPHRLHPAS